MQAGRLLVGRSGHFVRIVLASSTLYLISRLAAAPEARRLAARANIDSMGVAEGGIMPVIITAHISQSSSAWLTSHCRVIIQALAPVIGPYMSRAKTTIHAQQASGKRIKRTMNGPRWFWSANSRAVGGCSSTSGLRTPPVERCEMAVVLPGRIVPGQTEGVDVALRGVREREPV